MQLAQASSHLHNPPVLPIGAGSCRGRSVSRVALAPSRERRAFGRALDGDLCAARGCPAWRTAWPDLAGAVIGAALRLRHWAADAGQLTGARRRARRASARRGAAGRRPTVDGWPIAHSALPSGDSVRQSRTPDEIVPTAADPALGPDGWRAAGVPLKGCRESLTKPCG
jgi:hypothetical protein